MLGVLKGMVQTVRTAFFRDNVTWQYPKEQMPAAGAVHGRTGAAVGQGD